MQSNGKMVAEATINQVLVYKYRNKRPEEANSYQTPTAYRALGNILSH